MTRASLVWDVVLGVVGAALAYGVYKWTESGLWTMGCLAAYSLLFIWFRLRFGD